MTTPRKFDNLKFSLYENAHETKMYESFYRNGAWDAGKISNFHNLELSPAANILNYGQGIFEGMKAYRSAKGNIVMFRPMENARRFVRSCQRMAIPPVNVEKYMDAVKQTVLANAEFIPETEDGSHSLYLRPVIIGTEAQLGVKAASEYLFYIYASPVGPYFDKVGIISLWVTDIHRAAAHGTGDAKAAANYPGTMKPRQDAMDKGYNGALFLDTVHNRYIEEAGAANFFALMDDGTLRTPQLGSILPGITRESIIRFSREKLGLTVEEDLLDVEDICNNAKECFVCGTGAIVTSVSKISWKGKEYNVNKNDYQLAHKVYNQLIGIQLQKEADPYEWVMEIR